jgi:hypothetical protein
MHGAWEHEGRIFGEPKEFLKRKDNPGRDDA